MLRSTSTIGRDSAVASGNYHERLADHQAADDHKTTRGSKASSTASSKRSQHRPLTYNQKKLLEAAKNGDTAAVIESLAQNPSDVNAAMFNTKRTALHESIRWGQLEVTKTLLTYKPALDIADAYGVFPLHEAAQWGYTDALIKLLKAGADINAKSGDNLSALHLACQSGNFDTASCMLMMATQCENLNLKINDTDPWGQNALHTCIFHLKGIKGDDCSLVRQLIIAGVNPAKKNKDGNTPLHLSGKYNMPAIATALLQNPCVDVDARNNKNETPLIVAARHGSEDTALVLLHNNADINKQDNKKNTPIMNALSNSHLSMANMLLNANADLSFKNNSNQTAVGLAGNRGIIYQMYRGNESIPPEFQYASSPTLRYYQA